LILLETLTGNLAAMLDILLASTVPVFFVIALGYLAGCLGHIDNRNVAALNALVMNFALPAALFVATVQTPRDQLLEHRMLVLVLALSMLTIYGFNFFLQRRVFKLDTRGAAVHSLTVASPNYASVGLPLIGSVFGAENTVCVAIAIAVGSMVVSPLTLIILQTGEVATRDVSRLSRILRAMVKSLTKPIVVAPAAGTVLALMGATVPTLLANSLTLIGACAGGLALFLTGLILSSQSLKLNGSVATGTLLKNVLQPLLAAALAMAVAAPSLIGREAVVLTALPAGFFGILFGLRHGVVPVEVGSTLIASTVLSAATMAAAILLIV
jgi:malonate transporter and related proteins